MLCSGTSGFHGWGESVPEILGLVLRARLRGAAALSRCECFNFLGGGRVRGLLILQLRPHPLAEIVKSLVCRKWGLSGWGFDRDAPANHTSLPDDTSTGSNLLSANGLLQRWYCQTLSEATTFGAGRSVSGALLDHGLPCSGRHQGNRPNCRHHSLPHAHFALGAPLRPRTHTRERRQRYVRIRVMVRRSKTFPAVLPRLAGFALHKRLSRRKLPCRSKSFSFFLPAYRPSKESNLAHLNPTTELKMQHPRSSRNCVSPFLPSL